MERAILFFDIDGTVLSEVTKEVPQSAIEAMEKARAEGHLLFINTGRTICSIPTEVRKFQFDGYLCGCGTYLTEHDEVLLKSSIEKQRGIELLRKAKECNLGVIAEGQEDCYFPGHISRFDRLESTRRYFASRGIGIEQSLESERFEYDKLFVYVDDKSDFDSFREYLGDDMEALDRGGKAYEVIQKDFPKQPPVSLLWKNMAWMQVGRMSSETAVMIWRCLNMRSMRLRWADMIQYWIHMLSLLQRQWKMMELHMP